MDDAPCDNAGTTPTPFIVIEGFIDRYRIPLAIGICVVVRLARYMLDRTYIPPTGFTTSYLMTVSSIQVAVQLLAVAALCWPWTEYRVARRLAFAGATTVALLALISVIVSARQLPPGAVYQYLPMAVVFGFAAYGSVSLALMSSIVYVRMRFWPRYPPGHCVECGYDLTGNVSGVCPECGISLTDEDPIVGN